MKRPAQSEFFKFGIVGLSNTIIGYLLYLLVLWLCEIAGAFSESDYIVATAISFVLSVAWSFYWNKKYTFKFESENLRKTLVALAKTYVAYSFSGLFLSALLMWMFVEFMGISKVIAPLLCLVITVPTNFVLNKFWAFKE